MKNLKQLIRQTVLTTMMLLGCATLLHAQGGVTVKGTVTDASGEPLIGASVVVKGNTSQGTVTDFDGNYVLSVPSEQSVIVYSYVGMSSREVKVGRQRSINVTLQDDTQLEEVIVVGYGQQKKASVVGAITQTTGEVLERAAGITDIGSALTGNLPGVVTTASSGIPGEEDPQIIIRGQSSWNNSSPLILVDGIERPMSSVDIQSVATISVLKDASATAVYGVKGANGVILITTKRGTEGKAQIGVSANAVMKIPSMLPDKLDSYDALVARNMAIEHELNLYPESFSKMLPMSFIENYRKDPNSLDEFGNLMGERYPNVDWQRAMFKKSTMSYNANLNISGGTKFVKYFASVDFANEGDLFKSFPTGRHYDRSISYNRVNVRSNLDFQITKSTVFKVNIAGSNGKQTNPWERGHEWDGGGSLGWQMSQMWAGVYNISPDAFLPQYSDGSWGFLPGSTNVSNSAQVSSIGGVQTITTTRINTDFVLEQQLDFITKGLSLRGMISWDNVFREDRRGIADLYNDPQLKWIDPQTGIAQYKQPYEQYDRFDYTMGNKWSVNGGEVNNNETQRNLNYQIQLNWARKFGLHDVGLMGNFGRQEYAKGSEIAHYREDWVFRATYNFANRYNVEFNGAYNGSEKFSKDNRFAFFASGAIGWTISEEKFMEKLREKHIIDMLKLRASYGAIGDDNVGQRWMYMTQWAYGGRTSLDVNAIQNFDGATMDPSRGGSPYYFYREAAVGNTNVHWEKVKKFNFGIDYGFLGGLIAGSFDIFSDRRTDILVGGSKLVPSYFGQSPAWVNLGEVKTHGYELEVRLNKVFPNKMRLWANMNMTHAINEVVKRDDPDLYPSYRKQAGYAIGQTHAFIDKGMMQTFDDLYGSPKHDSSDDQKLPGDYYIVDFNGDGQVDNTNDNVPYGYTGTPQNTYNATIGFEYKGFSCFAQFYGVTNVTRDVTMISFADPMLANVYKQGTWWSNNHQDAEVLTPRFNTKPSYYYGTQYLCDGSYIRLKNVEVAYTFTQPWIRKFGIHDLKVFVSANNLWLWTRMPDDRESNFSSNEGATGAYPTVKRINFGVKFNL
ncbi:MAG: TonB-dependent receptor [Prevotella sp.]|nr:TonB-dependent receptor [Prevotella sp.]